MARYIMTARRKAALRKAQLASARKRRKSRRRKETRIQRRVRRLSYVSYASVALLPPVLYGLQKETRKYRKFKKESAQYMGSFNEAKAKYDSSLGNLRGRKARGL